MAKYNVEMRDFADGSSEIVVTSRFLGKNEDEVKDSLYHSESLRQNRKNRKQKSIVLDSDGNSEVTESRSIMESLRRAKQNVDFLAKCNKWSFFGTLTLSPDACGNESPTYENANKLITGELHYLKKKYPDMKYLVVMEQGSRNGRWHAHGLFWSELMKTDLVNSGKKDKKHQPIFNLPAYRKGFTTFQPVRSLSAVTRYISKYIGKSLGEIPFGQHRYFKSSGLDTIADHRVRYLFDDKEQFSMLLRQLFETCDSMYESFVSAIDTTFQYFRFNAPALPAYESVATT